MKTERVEISDTLSECPKCGNGEGFHLAFRRKEDRRYEGVLVCPSCRFRFTVGEFFIPTGEPRPHDHAMDDS